MTSDFPRALEQYTAGLEDTVDMAAVRAERFKLVVDYGYGSTSFVMPNVLGKLGADVLGVNPFASTSGLISFDRDAHAAEVATLVKASGAHLGAVIDPDGEHLTLVDDRGVVLSDGEALLALVSLVSGHLLGDRIAVPVNVSRVWRAWRRRHGVDVTYTKLASTALMEAASREGRRLRRK